MDEFLKVGDKQLKTYVIYSNPNIQTTVLNAIGTMFGQYKREDVLLWLKSPANYQQQFREVSEYLYNADLHYKRIINYFAGLLTFDYILVPDIYEYDEEEINVKKLKKSFNNTVKWLNKLDIKDTFRQVTKDLLLFGSGYYFLRENDEYAVLQRLPHVMCRLVSKTNVGYRYAIDLSYLDTIDVAGMPEKIQTVYKRYKSGKITDNWYVVDPADGIAFVFDETLPYYLPPFIALFFDVLYIVYYKELFKTKTDITKFKLLRQKIPMGSQRNEFLISPDMAKTYHNLVKEVLPEGVGLVTTPMDIDEVDLQKKQSYEVTTDVGEKYFYSSAGVSNLLFNSEKGGAIALTRSIMTDEMFVIHLYPMFAKWINYQIKHLNNRYDFRLYFPDITYFNRSEKMNDLLKIAQYGFPKTVVASSVGLPPEFLCNVSMFENLIDLQDLLIPLRSSFTQGKGEAGRPTKPDGQITDKTAEGRDKGWNEDKQV